MKVHLFLPAVCLVIFPVSGFAQDAEAAVQAEPPKAAEARAVSSQEVRYQDFLASPKATQEQLAEILFKASFPANYSSPRLVYEFQNTLRDSVLLGAILEVTYLDPESKKERTIDVYADLGDVMPLSQTDGSVAVFQAAEIQKLDPKISLKEIRLRKIAH